jgi:Tol biopolymer transport system component
VKRFRLVLLSLLGISLALMLESCGDDHSKSNQFAFIQYYNGGFLIERQPLFPNSRMLPPQRVALKPSPQDVLGGNISIVLMNNDGTGQRTVASQLCCVTSTHEGADGKEIVFVADENVPSANCIDVYCRQVFYMDLQNRSSPKIAQLTTEATDHGYAQISLDGKTVVYGKRAGGYQQAVLMSAGGGEETVISTPFNVDDPTFTPDGRIVFVRSDPPGSLIYIMNSDGTGLAGITKPVNGQHDFFPSVSPDGRTITFTRLIEIDNGTWDIWTANIDGSNAQPITSNGSNWQSQFVNGKIVFCSWRDTGTTARSQIYSMNPDGMNVKRITSDVYEEHFY